MSAFAAVLALAAAAAWIATKGVRPVIRLYLRFACVLYAALAASVLLRVAPHAVAVMVATLAVALLTLAAFAGLRRTPKPGFAAMLLAGACAAGIWSAATGMIALAVVPQAVCLVAVLTIAHRAPLRRPGLHLVLGAGALFAASCSLLAGDSCAFIALLLFSAAGLLGVVLALARASEILIDQQRAGSVGPAVRRVR
ncbi:MAG: hypothetical protein KGJ79_07830 [Alphaproteobacteria bacterium]|nr:hypothetical protein [Alphaproteobacteria bacterium]MDE2111036.1 hypothetical protein [Alphaproteobacteria bacterium]MDE2493803.1 hypothetical protein [Alphaproteobacteria bacterium]